MGFLRSPSPPPPPPPPPPPIKPTVTPQGSKEQQRVKTTQAKKKGQMAARVTGGQGLLEEAPTEKVSLLGQNKRPGMYG